VTREDILVCHWCGLEGGPAQGACKGCGQEVAPQARRIPRKDLAVSHEAAWETLEAFLGKDRCAKFMYMCTLDGCGVRIHLYKHTGTRQYLNLGEDGTPYQYVDDVYQEIPADIALKHAFS